ncbi:MAG: HAD-IA family hydrolase [Parvularculales bacterium]
MTGNGQPSTQPASSFRAVVWDFGGVITSSPFDSFNRFEADNNLPKDFIRRINATNPDTNAWAQFESNQIDLDEFDALFTEEARQQGGGISGRQVINLLRGDIRPGMVEALRRCKTHFKTGCITNNTRSPGEWDSMLSGTMALFDHVIESSKAGMRKPDPRIYAMMCETLGVNPHEVIYLDDLGINLKPARAMGMATIKVASEPQALAELEKLTGLTLVEH